MQLYRGMDIGTAKLTLAERRGVPHHQLDVLDITEEASLAAYQQAARAAIGDLRARGRVAVLAGGSGLYVRAALDALAIPPTDAELRAAIERRLEELGPAALHDGAGRAWIRLRRSPILPSNGRRIVRALEVVELTGEPFSAMLPEPVYAVPTVQIGLRARPRPAGPAHRRPGRPDVAAAAWSRRCGAWLRAGCGPLGRPRAPSAMPRCCDALDGRITLEQAKEQTAQATRRLIRRQESWFRRDPRIHWLDPTAPDLVERALAAVDRGSRGMMGPWVGSSSSPRDTARRTTSC